MNGSRMLKALSLGLCLVWASTAAWAQPGQDDGPMPPFAGGQMVRGTITAVAADRLTVKTETGDTVQVVATPSTRIRKGRDQVKLTDAKVGDGVGAMGAFDAPNKTEHAMMIMVVDAEQLKKAREAMGKSYIAGKVTAIDMDALKITVQREDGVSQTIGLDDDTSFKRGGRGMNMMMAGMGPGGMGTGGGGGQGDGNRGGGNRDGGGESITLADVKVGDEIAGPGTLKNGVFVPTELRVANPPPPGGGRRRRPGDGAPATPPMAAQPGRGA